MNIENRQNPKLFTRREFLIKASVYTGLPWIYGQGDLFNDYKMSENVKPLMVNDCSIVSDPKQPESYREELSSEEGAYRLMGCKRKGPVGLSVQSGYEDLVWEAAMMWKSAANIDFIKGSDITISVFSDPPADRPNMLGREVHFGKDGEPEVLERSIVELFNLQSVSPKERRGIAAHGLGHCLGFLHSATWDTLMSQPTFGPIVSDLTQADIDGIQAIYGHPLNEGWNWTEWKSVFPNPKLSNTRAIARQNEYGEWERWYQDVPQYANNLTQLARGENYWMLK